MTFEDAAHVPPPPPPAFEPGPPRAVAWQPTSADAAKVVVRQDLPWGPVDPGPVPDGTWQSEGYASSSTRAVAVRLALAVEALWAAFIIVFPNLVSLAVGHGVEFSAGQRDLIVAILGAVQPAAVAVSVVTLVSLLAWLSRAVDNVPPLTGRTPAIGPRGAIGWWFAPVACWVMPFRVVRDLAWRLRTDDRQGHPLIIPVWWAFRAGSGISGFLVGRWLGLGADAGILVAWAVLAAGAVGDVLLILVVTSLARQERECAQRLGLLEDGPRQWPAFAPAWDSIAAGDGAEAAEPPDGAALLASWLSPVPRARREDDPLDRRADEAWSDYDERVFAELEREATAG